MGRLMGSCSEVGIFWLCDNSSCFWIDDVMNIDGRWGGCRYRDSPLDLISYDGGPYIAYIHFCTPGT